MGEQNGFGVAVEARTRAVEMEKAAKASSVRLAAGEGFYLG